MPKPRALTPAQELAAFAEFRAAKGARGIISLLASKYRLTWQGMKGLLARVERETKIKDSRESLKVAGPLP